LGVSGESAMTFFIDMLTYNCQCMTSRGLRSLHGSSFRKKGVTMAKLSKFARVVQIAAILFSLSLDTIAQIEELLRKDRSLTPAQQNQFKV
jgi:hypothetical protein